MKRKLIISVAAMAALVGVGFASWSVVATVNDNIVATKVVTPTYDTNVNVVSLDSITVEASDADQAVKIDVGENASSTLKYKVKANTSKFGTGDEDAYSIYGDPDCAEEEVPYLKVSVESNNDISNYYALPGEQTFTNLQWLDPDVKEAGYEVSLEFKWAEMFGTDSFKKHYAAGEAADYKAAAQELENLLKDIEFTIHFEVVSSDDVVNED